jgi:hypothetical protein
MRDRSVSSIRDLALLALAASLLGCASAQSASKADETPAPQPKDRGPDQSGEPTAVAAKDEIPPGHRAVAATFSVPIPSGFEQYQDEAHQGIYDGGGVILAQSEPPKLKDVVQASIIVSPLPNKGLDLDDAILCFGLSGDAAKSLGGSPLGARKIERAGGPTCQVLVKPAKEKHKLARAEVVGSSSQVWMVTCTYDARDKDAPKVCDEVVDGFAAHGPRLSQR